MDKHLFKQIKEEAIKAGYDFNEDVFKMSNDLFKSKINTQNNETESWKNTQDERVSNEKFIYSGEVGISTIKEMKNLVYFGQCKRSLMFKINGVACIEKDPSQFDDLERNDFIKKQFLNKVENSKLVIKEEGETTDYRGLIIKSSSKVIYDPIEEKDFVLIVKPVNGSAASIRDKIWPKNDFFSKPMTIHLPEVLTELFIHKKKVKLIYLDKNKSNNIKVFTFGIENGILYYDDKKMTNLNVEQLCDSLDEIAEFIQDTTIVPERSYKAKCNLETKEIETLIKNDILNVFSANKLASGEEYENFMCVDCRYKEICNGIEPGKFYR